MMFGYIYKTTDTRNGLIYIGQHKAKRFNPFYFGSGRDICQLPYEERLVHYKVELLHVVADTGDEEHDALELDRLEILEIVNHHSTDPKIGYNRSKGGQRNAGWYKGTKGRITLHKGNITVRVHPDYVESYLNDGYEYGVDDITRKKMSEASKLAQSSPEYREKQRIAQTGKKRTDEMKKHSSDAAKKRWQDKEKNVNMYGRVAINNGEIVRHVQKEEAEQLVATGTWQYGAIKGRTHLESLYPIYNAKLDIIKRVHAEEIDMYLSTGDWQRGSKPASQEQKERIAKMRTGRVWMHKDGKLIQSKPEDVQLHLNDGWIIGFVRHKKNEK